MSKQKKKVSRSLLDYNSEDVRSGRIVVKKSDNTTEREKKQKRAKRIYTICVAAVSLIAALFIMITAVRNINEGMVMDLLICETDISGFDDGVYTSSYTSSHMSATVSVTVESGAMTDIKLNAFSGIDVSRAQIVFDSVIAYQMLNLPQGDAGSQPSDIILLKAIESALQGGIPDGGYSTGISA